jgi:6-phosphogluconolactonase (cycloisomerase 2 family)
MQMNDLQVAVERPGGASRRTFLTGAAMIAGRGVVAQSRRIQAKPASGPVLMYVGTYSSPEGPEGSRGRGEGIYLFRMDPSTGALTQLEVFANGSNPACLALNPAGTHLYSANETRAFQGKDGGSVSAYSISRPGGRLTLLNTVSSEGPGPAHLSVHPAGKYVLVANYFGGSVAVLPIEPDGRLGAATDSKRDPGPIGAERASSAPPGSFALSGHDRPHAHMIQADRPGKFVLASDLGMDQIFVWKFDAEKGALSANDPPSVRVPPGDGPRHFAFHPNGRWLYSIQEEGSTLILFDYDANRGVLTGRQTISTLPKGFAGTNYTSEVMVSSDGRFVYAANRLHDSIAVFSISRTGELAFVSETWTRGDYPRSFNIDPTGNFLYSCNQRSDAVTTFRIDRNTGELIFTGQYTPAGTPSSIVFLE